MKKPKFNILLFTFFGFLFLLGCNVEPKPMNYGVDVCEHCKMTIVDTKWGAEILTKKGKIYKFDVVECMINYLHHNNEVEENLHSAWTVDFLDNKKFLNAKDALYVRSLSFHSPMGLNAVSIENEEFIKELKLTEEVHPVKYQELVNIVYDEFGYTK